VNLTGVRVIRRTCPECGSKNVVRIHYGFETDDVKQRVREGRLAFGALAPHAGMPTHKCQDCQTSFRAHTWSTLTAGLQLATLLAALVLLSLGGYFAGRATILSDASTSAVMAQALADSFRVSTVTGRIALWLLGILALVFFESICVTKKIRLLDKLGYGYIIGYFFSAWTQIAWMTIAIGAITFVFVIIADATFAD